MRSALSPAGLLGGALASREEQRGLLAADRNDGDDGHALLERELDEPLAPAELDLVRMPGRAKRLVVAARIHEDGRVLREALRALSCDAATVPQRLMPVAGRRAAMSCASW